MPDYFMSVKSCPVQDAQNGASSALQTQGCCYRKNPKSLPLRAAWYSYSVGPVFFVAYSTEIDYSPGSAQYQYVPPCSCQDIITHDVQSHMSRCSQSWTIVQMTIAMACCKPWGCLDEEGAPLCT